MAPDWIHVPRFKRPLNRGTWIQSGAIASTESHPPHSRRFRQVAITAEKLVSIASHRKSILARAHESHPIRKLVVIRIAREDGALAFFEISHHVHGRSFATAAEHEFVVTGQRKPA